MSGWSHENQYWRNEMLAWATKATGSAVKVAVVNIFTTLNKLTACTDYNCEL